jgi:hypothetical protein
MTRKIKVRTIGSAETREGTIQEAEKILEDTYNDPVGGLVADARTGEVICKIHLNVEKIIIMEQMLGGG